MSFWYLDAHALVYDMLLWYAEIVAVLLVVGAAIEVFRQR